MISRKIRVAIAVLSLLVALLLGAIGGVLATRREQPQPALPLAELPTDAIVVHVETKSWTSKQIEDMVMSVRLLLLKKGGGPILFTHNTIGGQLGPEVFWWHLGEGAEPDQVGWAKYDPEKHAWVVCEVQADPLPDVP